MNTDKLKKISIDTWIKRIKVATILLLTGFLFAVIAQWEGVYHLLSLPITVLSFLLIVLSRHTQGHYQRISTCYAVGICIWTVANVLHLYVFPGNALMATVSENLFLLPNCCFSLGLIFFTNSEYNELHFQRMVLHTFVIAFYVFMVAQKLMLMRWSGTTISGEIVATVMYFFVVVFTIVFVFTIFYQTNFSGHTVGTNLSAVCLVLYNLSELRMIYFRTIGRDPEAASIYAIYVVSMVIFALAQSDPTLINRKPEPEDEKEGDGLKSRTVWIYVALILLGSVALLMWGFFDSRDLYTSLLAALAYVIVYKTIQTNELSVRLLKGQKEETARLERLVEEKTAELQSMNEHLMQLSTTDALTGLYNRRYGMGKLQELVGAGTPFAIFQMDLNYFKAINDTYGHDAGDLVLKEVGKRLRNLMPENMTSVRMGGDEFLLILEDAAGEADVAEAARRVCRWMDEPVVTPIRVYQFSATIGIACYPVHSGDVEKLLNLADQAMYKIKHATRESSYAIYNEGGGVS